MPLIFLATCSMGVYSDTHFQFHKFRNRMILVSSQTLAQQHLTRQTICTKARSLLLRIGRLIGHFISLLAINLPKA